MAVELFRIEDVTAWVQHTDRQIFLADVKDSSNSAAMSVWFGRYGAGASNDWTVTYDEMIVVISGRYTVRGEDGAKTAGPGEVIFLTKGSKVTYSADEQTTVVGATYPHWQDAQRASSHADMLNDFHPV